MRVGHGARGVGREVQRARDRSWGWEGSRTGDVVDVLLALGHARDVVLERGHLVAALGRVVHQQLGQLGAVAAVLVDAQLEVLGELLVELLEVLGVLLRGVRVRG